MIEPKPTQEALYDRLIALKPEGLSTRAWTINAGVSSAFFDNLAAGGSPREGELPKVLAVVGMTLAEFEGRRRANAQPAQAALPTLRVMPRAPKVQPATADADAAAAPATPAPAAPAGKDGAAGPSAAPECAAATAQAVGRWLEARRQAEAAGLDTGGVEGARLVSDLARLAFDLERSQI
jgi:hypothetical protein